MNGQEITIYFNRGSKLKLTKNYNKEKKNNIY